MSCSFGVCCLFTLTGTGGTVTRNCSYLQSPGFPATYSEASGVSYTVQRINSGQIKSVSQTCKINLFSDVCSLRLDFETFTTRALANTLETTTDCQDSFTVTVCIKKQDNIFN